MDTGNPIDLQMMRDIVRIGTAVNELPGDGPYSVEEAVHRADTRGSYADHTGPETLVPLMQRLLVQAEMCATIFALLQEEGNSVDILCQNPDPDGPDDNYAIDVFGAETNWDMRRFYGATHADAVRKAAEELL